MNVRDGWVGGWIGDWMGGHMDGWMFKWVDGRWMGGWMDSMSGQRMAEQINFIPYTLLPIKIVFGCDVSLTNTHEPHLAWAEGPQGASVGERGSLPAA